MNNVKFWIPIEKVESSALDQIKAMTEHPRLYKHVAIMPDVHAGIGATIGSVIPIDNAVIPSAVGVDIGCGMCCVKTDLKLEEIYGKISFLPNIYGKILERIPRGFDTRTESQKKDVHKFASLKIINSLRDYENICSVPLFRQLGTLGGGNHFIELQVDKDNNVYIMLHSGSRNIGNVLAVKHIKKAKLLQERYKIDAPKDLEYFDVDTEEGKEYIKDMTFALNFAKENRFVMMEIIKEILQQHVNREIKFDETINIHHNYAAIENHFGKNIWVHRKGATRVTSKITGIIPGSMGSYSYLVTGKDNTQSFHSCSHGAGRTMSRKKAKEEIKIDKFKEQMQDVYSESVDDKHLDEAPDAYKSINEVMENQKELVDIIVELKPVLNVKG